MIYSDGIHLVADSLDELHEFAKSIGLKRSWFQRHKRHPHYDLKKSKIALAFARGAIRVTSKDIIHVINGKQINVRYAIFEHLWHKLSKQRYEFNYPESESCQAQVQRVTYSIHIQFFKNFLR